MHAKLTIHAGAAAIVVPYNVIGRQVMECPRADAYNIVPQQIAFEISLKWPKPGEFGVCQQGYSSTRRATFQVDYVEPLAETVQRKPGEG